MTATAKTRSTFPLAPLSLEEAVEQIADLAGQREKLLSALKAVVASAMPNSEEHPMMARAWDQAEAAIQQAEGKRGQS